MLAIYIIISVVLGYIFGSIPFGVVIGKIFFHKDVREYGSHNSGGTNTGRVLGKKVGLIVIILDALKCMIAILLNKLIFTLIFKTNLDPITYHYCSMLTGFFTALGHCFPIFAKFKGGKAAATIAGFILSVNWIVFLMSIAVFFLVHTITKYVSLGSILSSVFGTILCWIPIILTSTYFPGLCFGLEYTIAIPLAFTLTTLLLIYRHKENIVRMINHQESKSYLFKKKK